MNLKIGLSTSVFLSTLSLRRATTGRSANSCPACYFYPRSPCGERHLTPFRARIFIGFLSTLSLRRATVICSVIDFPLEFLSTLSLRRATCWQSTYAKLPRISIHALLAESDQNRNSRLRRFRDFYPRSPCGERRQSGCGLTF